MYETWPNALELPLGQEEGSREAQSRERSERVGWSSCGGLHCRSGSTALPETVCRMQGSMSRCFQCCTKRLLSAAVSVA